MHPKGTNSMAMSGLRFRRPWFGTGWHGSFLSYAQLGLEFRKQSSHLVGPPIQALTIFHSLDWWLLAKSIDC